MLSEMAAKSIERNHTLLAFRRFGVLTIVNRADTIKCF